MVVAQPSWRHRCHLGSTQLAHQRLREPGLLGRGSLTGSNTTGMVAEALERRWLAIDTDATYLEASKFRFDDVECPVPAK